ncbi:MAG: TIGR01212 family radical SAM protein [Desulfosarcinaceae bacterium]|nr:TIGR01212 family radical SAM protein [Desulfosarcinaceae bacterium]
MTQKRYFDLNTYFRNRYGGRVHKITVDAGFTCPNRDGRLSQAGCLYCNDRGSGTGQHRMGLTVRQQLERSRAPVIKRFKTERFLAYFQAFTNTYAPVDRLKQVYDEALEVKGVVGLAVGTRPDCVDARRIDLLASYTDRALVWVEYGLQSVHDQTLKRINRGHDFAAFEQAVALTRERGIKICAHVILGLPGETPAMMHQTAETLAQMGLDGIKLHLLYVVKETSLDHLYRAGRYSPLEMATYAELVCDVLERLPQSLVIQRLTGDPHPAELRAPLWALDKKASLAAIHSLLERRDSWQGKALGLPLPDHFGHPQHSAAVSGE